jgi:hypothetical protein
VHGGWIVTGLVTVDQALTLRLRLLSRQGTPVLLAKGSVLGKARSGRAHHLLMFRTDAGTVAVTLRLPTPIARGGHLELTATGPGGETKAAYPVAA